jgi:hypothetical protein
MKTYWLIFAGVNILILVLLVVLVAWLGKRQAGQDGRASEEQQRHWETRSPGWKIRCRKCNFSEPYGKYGIRLGGAGRKYTLGHCSHCRGMRFQVIERPKAHSAGA